MRAFWSYAGLALALLVAALLIVPGFLDWSGYAGVIEEEAEAITGREVEITGDVRISLLPSPELRLGGLTIANAPGGSEPAMLTVDSMTAEIGVAALFRGEFAVDRLTLDHPSLVLERTPDGRSNWKFVTREDRAGGDVQVSIGEIAFANGVITMRNLGFEEPVRFTDVQGLVSAQGLNGPYRAKGTLTAWNAPASFAVAIGEVQGDKAFQANAGLTFQDAEADLRGIVTGRGPELRFDGALSAGVRPALSEHLAALTAGQPLTLKAGLVATGDSVTFREVDGTAGAVKLTGEVSVETGQELRANADLNLNRLDLAALEAAGVALNAVGVESAVSALVQYLPEGDYTVAVADVRLPDSRLSDVSLVASVAGDSISVTDARALLPGNTSAGVEGVLASSEEGPYFSGDIAIESGAADELAAWLAGGEVPPVVTAQGLEALSLTSGIFLTPRRFSLDRLDATAGETSLKGQIASTFGERPNVSIALEAGRVAAPFEGSSLWDGFAPGRAIDFGFDGTVALKAAAVDAGPVHLANLSLGLEANGHSLSLKEFVFTGANGASGTVTGSSDAGQGRYQITLTAPDAAAFAEVLGISSEVAADVSPLSLTAQAFWPPEIDAEAALENSSEVSALGRIGDAQFDIEGFVTPGEEGLADASFDVTGAMTAQTWQGLVRAAVALGGGTPGEAAPANGEAPAPAVTLAMRGQAGTDLIVAADFETGPLRGTVTATADWRETLPVYAADLDLTLTEAKAFAAAAGARERAVETAAASGKLVRRGSVYEAENISLRIGNGDQTLDGDLTGSLDLAGEKPAGDIRLLTRAADVGLVRALLQGPETQATGETETGGAEASANPGPASGWDAGRLETGWLEAANLTIAVTGGGIVLDSLQLEQFSGELVLVDGMMSLKQGRGTALGGEVRVSGTLEAKSGVTLDLSLAGTDMDLAALEKVVDFGRIGTGRMDIDLAVQGSGLSELALVSSLTGEGQVVVRDGALAGLDLPALSEGLQQIKTLDAFAPLAERTLHEGETPYTRIAGKLAMTSGVLRAPAITAALPSASGEIAAFADLGRLAIDVEADFDLTEPAEAPVVQVVFAGDFSDAERSVNSLSLEAYAAQRLLERDIDALAGGAGSKALREMLGLPAAGAAEGEAAN